MTSIRLKTILTKVSYEFYAYIVIISEGFSWKDRLTMVLYLLLIPLRFCMKVLRYDYSREFIRSVTLKNMHGIYYCGKSFNTCRILSSFHEKDIDRYFDLKEGVFVDVGAHAGKYTIRLANQLKDNGTVVAIEPEPNNFEVLSKNIELNNLKNIHLENIACFHEDNQVMLHVDSKATTLHSIYKNDEIQGGKGITVESRKLDSLLPKLNIFSVSLLKIDVEGAELDVLKGAVDILTNYHPKIIFEAWDDKYLQEAISFLNNFDYKIKKINKTNYLAC